MCERELDLCDLFVVESGRRFRMARDSIQSAQDEVRRRVAQRVRADGGYTVTDAILDMPDPGERIMSVPI